METKEIIANNKLIAEFMDALTLDSNGNSKEDITKFKYHSSWDWLMPVVEKIENLEDITTVLEYSRGVNQFTICCGADTDTWPSGSKIEAVYKACVEFIQWYNENK